MNKYTDAICFYYTLLFSASKTRCVANNKLVKTERS